MDEDVGVGLFGLGCKEKVGRVVVKILSRYQGKRRWE